MRFFGYYALHTFVNQLKKLFRTWVIVFILVCGLIGGLIGYGAATLAEVAEEQNGDAQVEQAQEEEDSFQLPISGDGLVELIVGGGILALFVYEALSADKNGSKIFLPADVNLLFPSPMKPQSVLMFRLATQLGTAIAATIYMLFQLPNLILNLGLSGWTAAGILITWFASILAGKLLQVLLYTVCSTHTRFKAYLSKGVYALILFLGFGFFGYYRSSGLEPLVAADRFFNAPFTRWLPLWGWLKGLTVFSAQRNWQGAVSCAVLLTLLSTALIYGIWHINADFYEDAMAKSEETAALLEKAKSEKSSGVAATKKRKKDRKDSLLRDGMKHGSGANIFFYKTMYNRFRFAHFHFFTKTMETYLAAALGTAALMRFIIGSANELPVVLTLGGLVFFRAMGNPLEEDTSMDFFRMIPESTWQKLFFSLLGGTINCLLDLILPILAASALLSVNPTKLLIWLPVIVSVDFYATSVGAFIDLSIPITAGKTIKTFVQVMFVYFGLLPDVAIMAVGIVLHHLLPATAGTTALNLALGFLFFSLASIFLQPKGRDVAEEAHDQDLKAAGKRFSLIGLSIFVILAVLTVLQIGIGFAARQWFPDSLNNTWALWLITFAPQYLAAMPLGLLILRKIPAYVPEKQKLGLSRGVKFFFISILMMYGGNLLGVLITSVLGAASGNEVANPLMSYVTGENIFAQILFMVILAPIMEELIFRKQLIDRMRVYGGKSAVLVSALLFGLFHGNLSQFFYAFLLGLVFGYIYLNTGNIRNTVAAHMIVNFMGSVVSVALVERAPLDALAAGEFVSSPWLYAYFGYAGLLVVGSVIGLVLLCMNAGRLRFPAGQLELPKGSRFRVICCNPGMILALLGCAAMVLISLFA